MEESKPIDVVDWYLAFAVICGPRRESVAFQAESCVYLVAAKTREEAYKKALDLGEGLASRKSRSGKGGALVWEFKGLEDLVELCDPPEDGVEILWFERELSPAEIEKRIKLKSDLHAVNARVENRTGWYIGQVILEEVHDEGSHGSKTLVWVNSYLINANSSDAAYLRAVALGREQQDHPGSHRCDGEKAHWEFRGLQELTPSIDSPEDGGLLWCEVVRKTAAEIDLMVRSRSDLSLFKSQSAIN